MTVLVVTAVKVYADLVAVFLVFLYLLLLLLMLWLLHGKTVRSEGTGDILFFDVVALFRCASISRLYPCQ